MPRRGSEKITVPEQPAQPQGSHPCVPGCLVCKQPSGGRVDPRGASHPTPKGILTGTCRKRTRPDFPGGRAERGPRDFRATTTAAHTSPRPQPLAVFLKRFLESPTGLSAGRGPENRSRTPPAPSAGRSSPKRPGPFPGDPGPLREGRPSGVGQHGDTPPPSRASGFGCTTPRDQVSTCNSPRRKRRSDCSHCSRSRCTRPGRQTKEPDRGLRPCLPAPGLGAGRPLLHSERRHAKPFASSVATGRRSSGWVWARRL